jgi:hypothetical protein
LQYAAEVKEMLNRPVTHPSAWKGRELRESTGWILDWPRAGLAELESGIVGEGARAFMDEAMREVTHGRGFVLLRGLPVIAYDDRRLRDLYWMLGKHWGTPVTQNAKGDRIGEILDRGFDANRAGVKPSLTNAEQRPHSDPCDVVALLCVHPAKSGGLSRIASSLAIYNRLLEESPAALQSLHRGFHHDLRGDETPQAPFGCTPDPIPVYRWQGDLLSCVFNASSARQAAERMGRPMPAEELAILDRIVELAHSDEFRLDMAFEPGDIQLLNNHTVIHWRTGFEDWPEPWKKRRLYRLWLNRPGERPVDPAFQRGYITGSNAGMPVTP